MVRRSLGIRPIKRFVSWSIQVDVNKAVSALNKAQKALEMLGREYGRAGPKVFDIKTFDDGLQSFEEERSGSGDDQP